MSKKTFIVDTNVLIADPNSIYSFDEHDVIIPLAVLEELDNQKSRQDEVGKNARLISRMLDDFRKEGNLNKGISLPNGGNLRIVQADPDVKLELPGELDSSKIDNIIIAFAYAMSQKGLDCTLVSRDINVRVKCDSLGVRSEDYLKMRVADTRDELYRGVARITLSVSEIDSFYSDEPVVLTQEIFEKQELFSNEILVIKDEQETKSAIARFVSKDKPIRKIQNVKDVFGLTPRNKEQQFALDLLLDDDVKLVTLCGGAGTGKTILAIAAGMQQVFGGKGKFERLIVTRPIQPMGKDIGFLPGTFEEKMEPWIAPIRDNLNFLIGNKTAGKKQRVRKDGDPDREFKRDPYLEMLFENGKIEIEALTYIRGRSIPNSFILIDEAQNLSIHELKTIITRVGDGTKVILTGDYTQIDNVHVDVFTNGLTYAIEKFKEYPIAGHVTLIKGERSVLATLAAEIL